MYDDSDDTQVLLHRTELLGINEEANYIITVKKQMIQTQDSKSLSFINLNFVKKASTEVFLLTLKILYL